MAIGNGQDERILPFTLSEIFVLLFFALALALAWETQERQRAETSAQENEELAEAFGDLPPEVATSLATAISQLGGEIPDDFTELTRELEKQQGVRARLETFLAEAGTSQEYLDSASLEVLVDSVADVIRQTKARADAIAAAAGMSDSDEDVLESLADSLGALTDQLENTRGQLSNLQQRVGNGLDHPPCWADEAGNIEYAFEATLRTDTIHLREVWPAHRDDDAASIPGMTSAAGTALSRGAFSDRVLPIFAWSTQQDPECRHFVSVIDSVFGGKEPFKEGLLTVERFFYKRLEN